jgi:hypothetical protein
MPELSSIAHQRIDASHRSVRQRAAIVSLLLCVILFASHSDAQVMQFKAGQDGQQPSTMQPGFYEATPPGA